MTLVDRVPGHETRGPVKDSWGEKVACPGLFVCLLWHRPGGPGGPGGVPDPDARDLDKFRLDALERPRMALARLARHLDPLDALDSGARGDTLTIFANLKN